jgi:hypothetical protein
MMESVVNRTPVVLIKSLVEGIQHSTRPTVNGSPFTEVLSQLSEIHITQRASVISILINDLPITCYACCVFRHDFFLSSYLRAACLTHLVLDLTAVIATGVMYDAVRHAVCVFISMRSKYTPRSSLPWNVLTLFPKSTQGTLNKTGFSLSADFVIYVVHQWLSRGCAGTVLLEDYTETSVSQFPFSGFYVRMSLLSVAKVQICIYL